MVLYMYLFYNLQLIYQSTAFNLEYYMKLSINLKNRQICPLKSICLEIEQKFRREAKHPPIQQILDIIRKITLINTLKIKCQSYQLVQRVSRDYLKDINLGQNFLTQVLNKLQNYQAPIKVRFLFFYCKQLNSQLTNETKKKYLKQCFQTNLSLKPKLEIGFISGLECLKYIKSEIQFNNFVSKIIVYLKAQVNSSYEIKNIQYKCQKNQLNQRKFSKRKIQRIVEKTHSDEKTKAEKLPFYFLLFRAYFIGAEFSRLRLKKQYFSDCIVSLKQKLFGQYSGKEIGIKLTQIQKMNRIYKYDINLSEVNNNLAKIRIKSLHGKKKNEEKRDQQNSIINSQFLKTKDENFIRYFSSLNDDNQLNKTRQNKFHKRANVHLKISNYLPSAQQKTNFKISQELQETIFCTIKIDQVKQNDLLSKSQIKQHENNNFLKSFQQIQSSNKIDCLANDNKTQKQEIICQEKLKQFKENTNEGQKLFDLKKAALVIEKWKYLKKIKECRVDQIQIICIVADKIEGINNNTGKLVVSYIHYIKKQLFQLTVESVQSKDNIKYKRKLKKDLKLVKKNLYQVVVNTNQIMTRQQFCKLNIVISQLKLKWRIKNNVIKKLKNNQQSEVFKDHQIIPQQAIDQKHIDRQDIIYPKDNQLIQQNEKLMIECVINESNDNNSELSIDKIPNQNLTNSNSKDYNQFNTNSQPSSNIILKTSDSHDLSVQNQQMLNFQNNKLIEMIVSKFIEDQFQTVIKLQMQNELKMIELLCGDYTEELIRQILIQKQREYNEIQNKILRQKDSNGRRHKKGVSEINQKIKKVVKISSFFQQYEINQEQFNLKDEFNTKIILAKDILTLILTDKKTLDQEIVKFQFHNFSQRSLRRNIQEKVSKCLKSAIKQSNTMNIKDIASKIQKQDLKINNLQIHSVIASVEGDTMYCIRFLHYMNLKCVISECDDKRVNDIRMYLSNTQTINQIMNQLTKQQVRISYEESLVPQLVIQNLWTVIEELQINLNNLKQIVKINCIMQEKCKNTANGIICDLIIRIVDTEQKIQFEGVNRQSRNKFKKNMNIIIGYYIQIENNLISFRKNLNRPLQQIMKFI